MIQTTTKRIILIITSITRTRIYEKIIKTRTTTIGTPKRTATLMMKQIHQ